MAILRSVIRDSHFRRVLRPFRAALPVALLACSFPQHAFALAVTRPLPAKHSDPAELRAPLTLPKGSRISDSGLPPTERQACGATGPTAMQLALRHYVKAAVPVPRRFLNAAGTDSGFTDAAMKTLIEFGPTYYYVGSEAVKAKLRDKLTTVGPWPVLWVVLRGDKKVGATTEIIRLGGHYVTGEFDGRSAVPREYTMVCGAAGWALKEVKEEKGA